MKGLPVVGIVYSLLIVLKSFEGYWAGSLHGPMQATPINEWGIIFLAGEPRG
ncbi:MAG TPA: hypothetical protein VE136_17555 [Anaerolineales bacterium]|nr:hypothetical protein [Anaerolineales bacterium]